MTAMPERVPLPGGELTLIGQVSDLPMRRVAVLRLPWLEDVPRLVLMGRNGRPRAAITLPRRAVCKRADAPLRSFRKRSLAFPFICRSGQESRSMAKHKLAPMTCDHCGITYMGRTDRPADANHYCGRRCSGIASRIGKAKPWQERFWRFLPDPLPLADECWEWTGYHRPPDGYGILPLGVGRAMLAHRASYFLHYEQELPPEIFVCHRCDNPPCVNPAHLFAGTIQDNNADKMAKGRNVARRGADNGMARIPTADVLAIRELAAAGGLTYVEIGRRFGTSGTHVGRIVNGVCRRES
jgi:hypothetical protein